MCLWSFDLKCVTFKGLLQMRGGRLAFYGSPSEAQTYFGTNDYADGESGHCALYVLKNRCPWHFLLNAKCDLLVWGALLAIIVALGFVIA
jgi:hypothetical protein